MSKNIKIKYTVFNKTDGFFASPDQMTKAEAEKFVKHFSLRYTEQGYYRTNKWEKIDPNDVELEIRPVILRSKDKSEEKRKLR